MDKLGFITYLEGKEIIASSIPRYIKHIEEFLEYVKKEDIQITKPDILRYLEYLKNSRKVQNITRQKYLIVLNHYFTFLYQDGQTSTNPCWTLKIRGTQKKNLYRIYTPEELETLFDNYYQLFVRGYDADHMPKSQQQYAVLCKYRNALILNILVYQGTTTGEIDKIETDDLDLIKATLKIRGGRIGNARILPLKATQIGLFIHYLQNIRPQLLEYHTTESNKLFLSLPAIGKKTTAKNDLMNVFKPLAKQVRSIDKKFLNYNQLRASVITSWLKTQGLRKAQYLAGHRYICCTERYITNNLDGLTEDINKLHPF